MKKTILFWCFLAMIAATSMLALTSCADVTVSGGGANAGNATATNNQPVDSNNNTTTEAPGGGA